MTNKYTIIFLIILILIILISITFLVSIFVFKAHNKIGNNIKIINKIINKNKNKKNSYIISQYRFPKEKEDEDKKTSELKDEKEEDEDKKVNKTKTQKKDKKNKHTQIKKSKRKKDYSKTKTQKKNKEQIYKETKYIDSENNKKNYSKGSSLPDQDFHSFGEYVSHEEKEYRTTLIKNLKVKTIVIDKLTNGNGVSQEFFKVVYLNNMIPAKILEEIVESKEFRNIIPKKYLSKEIKTKGLPKGDKIVFDAHKIRELLIFWSYGRLTPIQKAWIVKAEK